MSKRRFTTVLSRYVVNPVVKLAVRSMPTSGTPAELLSAAGIDAADSSKAREAFQGAAGRCGGHPESG